MEQGFTSVHSAELAARLRSRTGVPVSVTLVWNYPTIAAIAKRLMDGISQSPRQSVHVSIPTETPASQARMMDEQ
jgi:hypothetical protein